MHWLAVLRINFRAFILLIVHVIPKSRNRSIPDRTLASKLSPQLLLHIRASSSVLIVRLLVSEVGNAVLTRVLASGPSLRQLAGHFQRLLFELLKLFTLGRCSFLYLGLLIGLSV